MRSAHTRNLAAHPEDLGGTLEELIGYGTRSRQRISLVDQTPQSVTKGKVLGEVKSKAFEEGKGIVRLQ